MKKSILYDQLLITFAGIGVLSACGSSQAPVNATEVPETPGSNAPMSEPMPSSPSAGALDTPEVPTTSAPSAAPSASASAVAASGNLPSSKEMPKANHIQKVSDSKRKKACEASCGEGTCGSPCPK